MRTLVAVVLYDRWHNLEKWVHCWNMSDTTDAELVFIHNMPEGFTNKCFYPKNKNIRYIQRKNIGMDIGAFQDVCKKRLAGIDEHYDYLLWCTDDTLPMNKHFIYNMHWPLGYDKIGAVCYEISQEKTTHMRTTGMCFKKEFLSEIQFPIDVITTKEQCWDFEHGKFNLWRQIIGKSLSVLQVAEIDKSPLWDSGYNGQDRLTRKSRHEEFNSYWGIIA